MAYYIAVGIGAYAALSLTLFCFPNILHRRKKYQSELLEEALHSPTHKCLLVAHRGGARESLENTMKAFEFAVSKGSHMLEFDLHITKDKVVVVSHDENLIRLCNTSVNICDLNYDQLPAFAQEVELHFTDGERFQNEDQSIKFPKLEEVFEKFPETFMHIDLKGNNPDLIEATNKIVKRFGREAYTVWGAADGKKIDKLKKLNPKPLTFCSAKSFFLVFLLYIIGLLPFFPLSFNFFSVAKYTVDFERVRNNPNKPKPFVFKIAFGLLKFFDFISKPLFRHLQKRGILVVLWVLNDPKDFKEALEKQVNGIMTDLPSSLRNYLDEKEKYLRFPSQNTPLLTSPVNKTYT